MGTIAGIFGSITAFIAAIIGGAVTVTVVVLLFKTPGAISGLIGLAGTFLGIAGSAIAGFFSFLTQLVGTF